MGQANAEVFLLPWMGAPCLVLPCLAAHVPDDTWRKYLAWKIVRLTVSPAVSVSVHSRVQSSHMLPNCVCKPSLQHLILVRCCCCCCSCHASSGSAPAPVNCRLSWGSTLALAVIKRLNNASCLIIIYDTRRCRLLPEKPAGIGERDGRRGRGTWQDWKTL